MDVLVVGGGIVGLFCAYHLRRAGAEVTVLERGPVGGPQSCSAGNTGFVGTHGVDPLGGLSVRPRLDVDLLRWLWHFRRAPAGQAWALLQMKQRSLEILRSMSPDGFEESGMIIGFKTSEAFDRAVRAMPETVSRGIPLRVLEPEELRELEPDVEFDFRGAAYNEEGAYLRVPEFLTELSGTLQEIGVDIQPHTEVVEFEVADRAVRQVRTTRGDCRPAEVVLAAGTWSRQIARRLGVGLRLQPVKGYAVTVKARPPRRPVTLSEAKIAITPLGDRLRFGAVRELVGLDSTVSGRRVDGILRTVRDYLPHLGPTPLVEIWTGFRPCTPDSVPLIGRVERYRNLSVAAGHGHIGMGLAPAGGELLAQIVTGERARLDPAPFRIGRHGHAA